MSSECDLVRRYNQALQNTWGDFSAMRAMLPEFLSPNATLDEAPSLPWGGHWVGVDGFMKVFEIVHEALKNHSDPELRQVPIDAREVDVQEEYFSDGPSVFVRMKRPVESLEVFRIVDGKIDAITVYMFDTAAMANAL